MKEYLYITLREQPERKEMAATWFQSKWGFLKRHIWNAWSRS